MTHRKLKRFAVSAIESQFPIDFSLLGGTTVKLFTKVVVAMVAALLLAVPSSSDAQTIKVYHDWIIFPWCGGSSCSLPGPDTCCVDFDT